MVCDGCDTADKVMRATVAKNNGPRAPGRATGLVDIIVVYTNDICGVPDGDMTAMTAHCQRDGTLKV